MCSNIKKFLERLLMSKFFDSEIIQEELEEINQLQKELYGNVIKFNTMDRVERIEHIELLSELLDKQKVMYTRLSLSDDSEAVKLREYLQKSIPLMGFPTGTDVSILFDSMKDTIDALRDKVDF